MKQEEGQRSERGSLEKKSHIGPRTFGHMVDSIAGAGKGWNEHGHLKLEKVRKYLKGDRDVSTGYRASLTRLQLAKTRMIGVPEL